MVWGRAGVVVALAFGLVAGTVACVSRPSGYLPRSPGRVSVATWRGERVYVRDGRVHRAGLFGAGLIAAVAGNPEAEAIARRIRRRRLLTVPIGVPALLCVSGTSGYLIDRGATGEPAARPVVYAHYGCLAAFVVSFLFLSPTRRWEQDAINRYNDDAAATEGPRPPLPPALAPAAPPSGGP